MKKFTKIALVVASFVLVIALSVGATLAWLQDSTKEVVNTFTTTNLNIEIAETTGVNYEMVPGSDIEKDPEVSVLDGSEDCWLFVEITESENLDEYIAYEVDDTYWELYDPKEVTDKDATDKYVYVYKGNNYTASANQEFPVIKGNKVKVLDSVTNVMMDDAKTDKPTLTFKAYACQKENINDVATAWQNAQTAGVYPAPTTQP